MDGMKQTAAKRERSCFCSEVDTEQSRKGDKKYSLHRQSVSMDPGIALKRRRMKESKKSRSNDRKNTLERPFGHVKHICHCRHYRLVPTASISSMKTIEGACSLASLNISRTSFGPSPKYF